MTDQAKSDSNSHVLRPELPTFRDYPWRLSYRSSATGPGGKPVNILHDFYIPVLQRAVRYDRVAGYFRSTSLAAASQGFTAFAGRKGKIRLIVGADLDPKDVQAILNAYTNQGTEVSPTDTLLEQALKVGLDHPETWPENVCHGVQLLGWLIARQVLEIKVALRVHAQSGEPLPFESVEDGYVHMKWGVFADALGNRMYISGSLNESKTALTLNAENLDVHCEWRGETEQQRVEEADREFHDLWEDRAGGLRVLSLPEALRKCLIKIAAGMSRPQEIDGTGAPPLQIPPPSSREFLGFALIKDGPRLPGGRFVGLETAPITPWPHQQIVARRVISTWPCSYLLCDEVGLGKTIEAGLIIRSLYLSGWVTRVMVAAPASLTRQWQREMAAKFFLPFARALGGAEPRHEYLLPGEEQRSSGSLFDPELLIISTGLLVRQEKEALLKRAADFDLTLLDEAHYARRKNSTQGPRAEPKFGRLHNTLADILRPKSRCLLMATATPMQLDPVEVFDLIRLTGRVGPFQFDPGLSQWYYDILTRLAREEQVKEGEWAFLRRVILDLEHHDPHHHAYLKQVVVDGRSRLAVRRWLEQDRRPAPADMKRIIRLIFSASPLHRVMLRHTRALLEIYREKNQLAANLAKRTILPLPRIVFTPQEKQCYEQLEIYCQELATQIAQQDNKNQVIAVLGFYLSFIRLRFASSLFAIQQTLKRRRQRVRYTLEHFAEQREAFWEEWDLEDLLEDADEDTPFIQTLLENRSPEDLKWEWDFLKQMLDPLENLSGPSSKMQVLLKVLNDRRIGGTARLRQTVIFTRFYDTLSDIVDRLRRIDPGLLIGTFSGRGGQYTDSKTGRLVGADREEIRRGFLREEIDILVCTDAAAEGLNLQTADLLINFDLPWNPMKVEQRIGRVDRIGQKYPEVFVLNLCYADSAEEIVYGRLLSRLADVITIVGMQQISLLPVTREEFQLLAENKLTERELEKIARQRAELARGRNLVREMQAEELYQIYQRWAQSQDVPKTPIDLTAIWKILSESEYLQDLGCEVLPDLTAQTIIVRNIPGIVDATALTTSRQTFEYGHQDVPGKLHFASYGDPVFETLLNHLLSFDLPPSLVRLECKPPNGPTVYGYAVTAFDAGGRPNTTMVTSYDQLQGLHINDEGRVSEVDIQEMQPQLSQITAKELENSLPASGVEVLNQRAGISQLILNYLVARYLIDSRRKIGQGEENFWAEVKSQEQVLQNKEVISIKFPRNIAQSLDGMPFTLQIPQLGDKATLLAPIALIQSSMDCVCRLASRMHRSRADLSTEEVLARIDRELNKFFNSIS
ncbi:MAG: helicase [Deltaproteobacteria bacterium]|nr:helicase [Deltaproteobacteria bacterium]